MRDATHDDAIERWARYVRTTPDWKRHHTAFINAQFAHHQQFLKRLVAQPNGQQKVLMLYGIKNARGYEGLLARQQRAPTKR